MSIFVHVIGYLASICIPLVFLTQTIKIIKTKQTNTISIESYSIYFTEIIAFFIFAILIKDTPMIVCQTINGTFSTIILSITIHKLVKKKEQK